MPASFAISSRHLMGQYRTAEVAVLHCQNRLLANTVIVGACSKPSYADNSFRAKLWRWVNTPAIVCNFTTRFHISGVHAALYGQRELRKPAGVNLDYEGAGGTEFLRESPDRREHAVVSSQTCAAFFSFSLVRGFNAIKSARSEEWYAWPLTRILAMPLELAAMIFRGCVARSRFDSRLWRPCSVTSRSARICAFTTPHRTVCS